MIIIRPNLCRADENKRSIIVDGNVIEECKYVKLLGMYIDNQLSFQEHSKIITNKSRSTISALRRLAPFVNFESSSKVIKSCLISRISYGGLFYLCKKPLLDNMQKIVMKACRIAKRVKISDRVRNEDLLHSLKIPTLETIKKRQMLLQMSKWEEKKENIFPPMNNRTRGHIQGRVRPIGRSHRVRTSYLPQMQKVWNNYNSQLSLPISEKTKKEIRKIIS